MIDAPLHWVKRLPKDAATSIDTSDTMPNAFGSKSADLPRNAKEFWQCGWNSYGAKIR